MGSFTTHRAFDDVREKNSFAFRTIIPRSHNSPLAAVERACDRCQSIRARPLLTFVVSSITEKADAGRCFYDSWPPFCLSFSDDEAVAWLNAIGSLRLRA